MTSTAECHFPDRDGTGDLERYSALVQATFDAVILHEDGVVIDINDRFAEMFGYRPDEIIGKNPVSLLAAPESVPVVLEHIRNGSEEPYEAVLRRKDGREFHAEVRGRNCVYRGRRVRVVSAYDITERKRVEDQLRQAKDQAEAASRAKDHFLAVLSHELRTPLTPVLARAALLKREPDLSATVRDGLEMIRRNVELEARLIDDLLDLSKIIHGKLQLHLETVDVHDEIHDAIEIYHNDIQDRGLHVGLDLCAEHSIVRADPVRLGQVFWNLISNAVKYTPAGGCIGIRTSNDGERLRVQIIDSGIGIEPPVMKRLFNAFEQGEQTLSRRYGGLGLGLSISKTIIDLHGGRLLAASEGRGRGATFTVELALAPRPSGAACPLSPAPPEPRQALHILLVEDNNDTRRVLARLLALSGHRVKAAADMHSALELAENESFDIAVCDIGLPDGTGWDLMRALRALQPVKGIALSGYASAEDARRSIEAGFSEHLSKPILPEHLEAVIQQVAMQQAGGLR